MVNFDDDKHFHYPDADEENYSLLVYGPNFKDSSARHLLFNSGEKIFIRENWATSDAPPALLIVDSQCAMLAALNARIHLPFPAAILQLKVIPKVGKDTAEGLIARLYDILGINSETNYAEEANFNILHYKMLYWLSDWDAEGEGRTQRGWGHINFRSKSLATRIDFFWRPPLDRFLATNEAGDQRSCDDASEFAALPDAYKRTGVCRASGVYPFSSKTTTLH